MAFSVAYFLKGTSMDRTTPLGSNRTGSGSGANPGSAKVEDVAHAAHQATDRIADKAASQVDRLSGTAHRAVDSAAHAASSAAEWASAVPEQAKQVQTRLTEAASASIRERPIAIVAGALVIGYLLGRIGN
jgi:broad specificity phosphatase PhoE